MGEVVNEVTVVSKLWNLSSDPNNQPYIVRRNILPALLKFLQSKDPQVAQLAAESLKFLSSHPDNPEYMCREKGLIPLVVKHYQTAENQALKATLGGVLRNLHSAVPSAEATSTSSPTKDAEEKSSARTKQSQSIITLKISKLTEATSDDIEIAILKVKGAVSCNCNTDEQTVRVLCRIPAKTLVEQLKLVSGIQAEIVEDDSKPKSPSQAGQQTAYQRSLVSAGENSLAARLARQKEERQKAREAKQAQEGNMSRFFRKISAALWY